MKLPKQRMIKWRYIILISAVIGFTAGAILHEPNPQGSVAARAVKK